jgi:hypothetical protein
LHKRGPLCPHKGEIIPIKRMHVHDEMYEMCLRVLSVL